MKYGKTAESDSHADGATFKRVAELTKDFKARHKHIGCSELLEADMGTPEGVKKAAGKGYFTQDTLKLLPRSLTSYRYNV